MSFNRQIYKQRVVQSCYEILIKRNELSSPRKTWRNLKCILVSKTSKSGKSIYTLCNPKYAMSRKSKTMEMVKRSSCQVEEERDE